MSDEEIVRLYWARDEQAIRETGEKYGALCRRIARNILHSAADEEECVNDTYLHLWKSIPPSRPTNLTAFIGRAVRNIAINRVQFNHRQKRDSYRVVMFSELEAELSDETWETFDAPDLSRLINAFLRTEQKTAREVFIQRYFFSESVQSIADRYGFSESKIKSMLFRTRKRLRAYLNERGVDP